MLTHINGVTRTDLHMNYFKQPILIKLNCVISIYMNDSVFRTNVVLWNSQAFGSYWYLMHMDFTCDSYALASHETSLTCISQKLLRSSQTFCSNRFWHTYKILIDCFETELRANCTVRYEQYSYEIHAYFITTFIENVSCRSIWKLCERIPWYIVSCHRNMPHELS